MIDVSACVDASCACPSVNLFQFVSRFRTDTGSVPTGWVFVLHIRQTWGRWLLCVYASLCRCQCSVGFAWLAELESSARISLS